MNLTSKLWSGLFSHISWSAIKSPSWSWINSLFSLRHSWFCHTGPVGDLELQVGLLLDSKLIDVSGHRLCFPQSPWLPCSLPKNLPTVSRSQMGRRMYLSTLPMGVPCATPLVVLLYGVGSLCVECQMLESLVQGTIAVTKSHNSAESQGSPGMISRPSLCRHR